MNLPSAIIFLNNQINENIKSTIVRQLFIDEVISLQELNARLVLNPIYDKLIHSKNIRILVVLNDFLDFTNREIADLVLIYSFGNVSVEYSKYGPPGLTLLIERINIYDLLRANNSKLIPYNLHNRGCQCYKISNKIGGIFNIQQRDYSGVHSPNCDNIFNNYNFIHRKP